MISTAFKHAYARKLGKNRKRGLTLMEVAMVLAIVGIVIAAALLYYNSANTARQTTAALGQLAQIQTSVRSLYAGQSNYSGISATNLANSDALPASMISGTTIRHAFNGNVTIEPATTSGGGANSGFTVTFANVPQDACKQMLTKDLGRGLYSAGVGTPAVQPNLPFTLTAATTACGNTYNSVQWTFI